MNAGDSRPRPGYPHRNGSALRDARHATLRRVIERLPTAKDKADTAVAHSRPADLRAACRPRLWRPPEVSLVRFDEVDAFRPCRLPYLHRPVAGAILPP